MSIQSATAYDASQVAVVVARLTAAQDRRFSEWSDAPWGRKGYRPPLMRTEAELLAQAEEEVAKRAAFHASPRGRFVASLHVLRDLGFIDEEVRLYGIYSRSLGDVREPLNLREVSNAFAILIQMDRRVSLGAMEALTAILAEAGMAPAQREAA